MFGAGGLLSALIEGSHGQHTDETEPALAWRPWLASTLDEARERDLPLLLLLAESCDYWSAQQLKQIHGDTELCTLIENAFVPVLAAVHLAPMLARRVQECLAVTGDGQGWPVLCFCSPDGAAIAALPWSPARDADGRMGLARCCLQMATAWSEQADALRAQAEGLSGAWRATAGHALPKTQPELLLGSVEASAMAQADTIHGGFGDAPKQSNVALLAFLIARCRRADAAPALRAQVERSCQALVAGAIHDQLAGGFHRGCVDALWSEPFFEKRLIEQALISPCLLAAAELLEQPLLRDLACQALDWAVEELGRPDGSFAHGLHAVSRDVHGRSDNGAHYRWSLPGLANVLGQDGADLVARRFCDPQAGPTAVQVFSVRGELDAADMARLPSCCARLFSARQERPLPPREEWSSIAEQGMMLRALALAGSVHQRFRKAAARLFACLADPMCEGGLAHSWHPQGGAGGRADSADLAWAASGALAWQRCSGDESAGVLAQRWLAQLLEPWAKAAAAVDEEALLAEPVACVADDTAPAVLAVALEAALDLAPQDASRPWRDWAAGLLAAHVGALREAPLACAGLAAIVERDPDLLDLG